MRIYFDNIAFSLQKAGGVSAVWAELLKRIPQEYVTKYYEYPNNNIFRKEIFLPETKIVNIPSKNNRWAKQFDLKVDSEKKFIFHSSAYRLCTSNNALNVVTVHDFIDHYYNKNFLKRNLKIFRIKHCIEKADVIICVSENTKKDLLSFYNNIDVNKIYVVYNGKSDDFKIDKSDLKTVFSEINANEYVLFVGNRNGYKNFHLLVEAMSLYKEKKLVFVGGGNLTTSEKKRLNQAIGNNYKHFQGISNKELNLLYNNAYCLVYPSSYEGFGIPVIEAQSAGCPVIASDKSSLPEILGNSALLIKELSSECLLQSLIELENKDMRARYIQTGFDNAQKFSWNKMAQQYLEIYNRIWNNN